MGKLRAIFALVAVLVISSCAKNPLDPYVGSLPLGPGTGYAGVSETLDNQVLFRLTTASPVMDLLSFTPCGLISSGQGSVSYSWGGASAVYLSSPIGVLQYANTVISGDPNTTKLITSSPGIGGPLGDFLNSYYLQFRGIHGSNSSSDYCSLVMNFQPGGAPVNLSCDHGFTFWAKGYGNFGVQLAATCTCSGQSSGAYKDFNFYEYDFGTNLSPNQWKQFQVNFTQMQQMYGLGTDLAGVIREATGIQFIQETPYVSPFELDVDYVRFF